MEFNAVGVACAVLLAMLFLKAPVFIAVLSSSVTYFILTPAYPQMIIVQRIVAGIESIPLLAIPFFVCAGVLMNYTGVTDRIMRFCVVLTGRSAGGLGHVNVLLSTLMGGLSGSNMADAAMEAKMLVPEMEKQGFSKAFSTVLTATSSIITPLIPPGIAMILYGSIANVSIGKLFVAGIGPGITLCILLLILVSVVARRRGYRPMRATRMEAGEFFSSLRGALLPLCLPVIIIGGIRLGIFTPTEAGAIAIFYALFLGLLDRKLDVKDLWTGFKETVTITSSIMLIVGAASSFAWILTKERIPQEVTQTIVSAISNKWVFLLAVVGFLLIVGMFIEGNAAMIVLVPLLAPVAEAYGLDPIHFGIVFIFTMILGGMTPPMGTLMFITCGVTGCNIKDFIKEALPFYLLLFGTDLCLVFFPVLSTGIVDLIY